MPSQLNAKGAAMKHTDAPAVKPENAAETSPAYLILRSGNRPPCTFCYEGAQGDAFVADMLAAGWEAERIDEYLLLTAPESGNVVPFPLAHPLLRGIE